MKNCNQCNHMDLEDAIDSFNSHRNPLVCIKNLQKTIKRLATKIGKWNTLIKEAISGSNE